MFLLVNNKNPMKNKHNNKIFPKKINLIKKKFLSN